MGVKSVDIVQELRSEILRLEGFKPAGSAGVDMGLGPIKNAFPHGTFPLGAIHEFLSAQPEDAAATCGFISGLIAPLMGGSGTTLWISTARSLFPPALKNFGIQPDRFIFIDLQKEKDVLWAMDEALKCGALTAVVGEMQEIGFTDSRRLQLAVEQSRVTGFIVRHNYRKLSTTACVSRWKITSLPSVPISSDGNGDGIVEDLPGIGFPQWRVELLRIRNGRPGIWEVKWVGGKFCATAKSSETSGDFDGKSNDASLIFKVTTEESFNKHKKAG